MSSRIISTIIFFFVFFLIHGLVNYYIYRRGRQALSDRLTLRKIYNIIFLIGYLSSSLGMFFIRYIVNVSCLIIPVSYITHYIGSFWFGVMLYSFLFVLIIDLFRLFRYLFKFNPTFLVNHYQKFKEILLITSISMMVIILSYGYFNAGSIHITPVNIKISKKCSLKSLKVALISDIHVNPITSTDRMNEIVNRINDLGPDIIILAGDIVDVGIAEFKYKNIGDIFTKFRSRFGVYAVPGNHEYFDDIEETIDHISKSGIIFLRDERIKINNSFYLIGREDLRSDMILGQKRKSLKDLLIGIDNELPAILIDHQPLHLEEAADNAIDLQLSGHTHNGQVVPFNFLTDLIFEKGWGLLKKKNTYFYISSGIGTWGPPARIGSVPEIVDITLNFE